MGNAARDNNYITTLLGVSNADGTTPITLYVDPTTHRLLVSSTFNIEIPTGAVDGSNLVFTVLNTPSLVIIDGLVRRTTKGYTYSGGTITVDALTPPVYDIFSLF